jgi:hypothetical protein
MCWLNDWKLEVSRFMFGGEQKVIHSLPSWLHLQL